MIGIEQVIFRNMILDDGYMRKVLPFVKDEYFEGLYRKLYTTFKNYVEEYGVMGFGWLFDIFIRCTM